MTLPVLDTTALIDTDRHGPQVLAAVHPLIDIGEEAVVPVQAAIEYCAGRADPAAGMTALRRSFWVVPCDEDIALEAARMARTAYDHGRFPGWADVQIAATARQLGMPVVTRDVRHFEALGVSVVRYQSG